ncbi:MAG: hypothetical protein Tsb0021_11860 [Chlamydiales bacterium]
MSKLWICALLGLSLFIASCSDQKQSPKKNGLSARAVVEPAKGSNISGIVTFTEVDNGVLVVADIKGLKPGKHGFHVHEHGDCSSPDFTSAGGHFNPTNKKHGGPDSAERHVGDLGNIEAKQDGTAHYERVDQVIELSGPNSIVGKSILIHADEDDLVSQPTGNAGARIGCGIIELIYK